MKTAHNMQIVDGNSFVIAIDGLAGWLVYTDWVHWENIEEHILLVLWYLLMDLYVLDACVLGGEGELFCRWWENQHCSQTKVKCYFFLQLTQHWYACMYVCILYIYCTPKETHWMEFLKWKINKTREKERAIQTQVTHFVFAAHTPAKSTRYHVQ